MKEGEVIYGLTTDGKIYLNPSIATANTAIHEVGHIWVDYVQNMKPELFNKGIQLVEGTEADKRIDVSKRAKAHRHQ